MKILIVIGVLYFVGGCIFLQYYISERKNGDSPRDTVVLTFLILLPLVPIWLLYMIICDVIDDIRSRF